MSTLNVKDLPNATELDHAEMASVTGGTSYYKPSCWTPTYCPPVYQPEHYKPTPSTFDFNASQSIGQCQNVVNNNGNNAAYVCDITSTVNPTQSANNNINF
jgi:hypothetical protein